eukprot:6458699-Amphidinium_carterae.1
MGKPRWDDKRAGHPTHSDLGPARRCPRELFPLPVVPWCGGLSSGGCRGSVQRRQRAFRYVKDVNSCIVELNALALGPMAQQFCESDYSEVSLGQSMRVDHVMDCVKRLGKPPPELGTREAISKLRLTGAYDSNGGPVPYQGHLVALPEAGAEPVPLQQLLGHGGDEFIERFCMDSVLDLEEVAVKK